ncbi:MAG TPA: hypothetical protein VK003_02560 [Oceanobacillus sp.]|nr:hypothetical protein [Oceanobacillus sp.]
MTAFRPYCVICCHHEYAACVAALLGEWLRFLPLVAALAAKKIIARQQQQQQTAAIAITSPSHD